VYPATAELGRRPLDPGFRQGDVLNVLKRFARNPELLGSFEPPAEAPEEV